MLEEDPRWELLAHK